jgi:hypothetical protein
MPWHPRKVATFELGLWTPLLAALDWWKGLAEMLSAPVLDDGAVRLASLRL